LPLVLLEAMQWHVPIVATAVGAIPELLGDRRREHLIPPNDLAALTHELQGLMSGDSKSGEAIASVCQALSGRLHERTHGGGIPRRVRGDCVNYRPESASEARHTEKERAVDVAVNVT